MEKLMQLAAKRAAKKAKKRAGKRKVKPSSARRSDADLARDLRAAAENYNAALRSIRAADALLDGAIQAVQSAGLGVVQEGIRAGFALADEITFTEISRPL